MRKGKEIEGVALGQLVGCVEVCLQGRLFAEGRAPVAVAFIYYGVRRMTTLAQQLPVPMTGPYNK